MQAASRTGAQEEITVLLLGDGPLLAPLEEALAAAGHDVEVGEADHAAAMFTAVAPNLVVLCGRATEHGGAPVLAALSEGARDAELKVVVLGAASSSARATALAPNLPAPELARRLVEIARAPLPAAKPAAKPMAAPKLTEAKKPTIPALAPPKPAAVAAPKPIEPPKPAAVAAFKPIEPPKPAAVAAPKPIELPKAVEPPKAIEPPKVVELPKAVEPPKTVELPTKPALAAEVPAPPPVFTPTLILEPAPDEDLTPITATPTPIAAAPTPIAAAPQARPRHISRFVAVAALAASALGLLLLPVLGSHAKGARKLSVVEITGPSAPKVIALAAAPIPVPIPAPAPAPSVAAEPPVDAPSVAPSAPEPAAAAEPVDLPAPKPAAADRDASMGLPAIATRGLSREASLGQAKASVRKAEGYVRDGRLGMAEAAYLKALSLFPRYPLAIAGLARIHLQRRDAGEALRWAKMLVAAQPSRGANQRMLGDAYALSGKQADAMRAWQQAVRYGDRTARQRLGD